MHPNLLSKKGFYNTFLELFQSNLDHPLFVEFKDDLQGQFFTQQDGFSEHDKRLMGVMDSVLNKVFGYVGLLLLKTGIMSFTKDSNNYEVTFMTFDHRYMTEIMNTFGLKPATTTVTSPFKLGYFSDVRNREFKFYSIKLRILALPS